MRLLKQSFEILSSTPNMLGHIEKCGRTAYKSENNMCDGSAEKFCRNIIKNGHESVLEHGNITVKLITDRGVSHELVRHRIASYTQESTRYCNYSSDKFDGEVAFILPSYATVNFLFKPWLSAIIYAEKRYFEMLSAGASPQQARDVLPNSLKTEVVITANIREWRNILKLRTDKSAHPQMVAIMTDILTEFKKRFPILFDDILL